MRVADVIRNLFGGVVLGHGHGGVASDDQAHQRAIREHQERIEARIRALEIEASVWGRDAGDTQQRQLH